MFTALQSAQSNNTFSEIQPSLIQTAWPTTNEKHTHRYNKNRKEKA